MTGAALALAAMLKLAEPGVTDGSRIDLGPDEPCPEFVALSGLEPEAPGFTFMRAEWSTWTRRETEGEALARWATIAVSIDAVTSNPPPAWKPRWGKLALTRALVTIARHESAYWRSVHEGRLRGPAGEVCLVQIHPVVLASFGIDPESLVGLDQASTERCLRLGAELLGLARGLVESREEIPGHWFGPSVAVYGAGKLGGYERPSVLARVKTYARTADRRPLPFRARIALEPGGTT